MSFVLIWWPVRSDIVCHGAGGGMLRRRPMLLHSPTKRDRTAIAKATETGGSRARGAARRRLQVALLIETSNAYARGLLEGVTSYLREHRSWSIYLSEHGRGDSVPAWLRGWKGDGIIARVENRRIATAVKDCGLPTVDLSAARLLPDVPWVETDNEAIARLALDHLRDRGFRNLGF